MSAERAHPAMVTSRRLGRHYENWFDRFSGRELVAINEVREALRRIAGEDENPESIYGVEGGAQ